MTDDPRFVGSIIDADDEVLRRVVPAAKAKWLAYEPGSNAFKPRPEAGAFQPGGRKSRDNGGLSTKRGHESPESAFAAYCRGSDPPREAIGTWGISVSEAGTLELPAYADGGVDGNPEFHATVWFPNPAAMSNRECRVAYEALAEGLLQYALARGSLFRPT